MNWHNDQRLLPSLVCLSKLCLKFLYTHVVGNGINVYKIHISPAIAPAICASDKGVWHRPKNISYTQSKCTTSETPKSTTTSRSKCSTAGPWVSQSERSTLTTAVMSSSVISCLPYGIIKFQHCY